MSMPIFFKKRHLLAKIMAILAFIALTPCFASGYSVSYRYYVHGESNDPNAPNNPIYTGTGAYIPSTTTVILDNTASVSGEVTQCGNNENYGTVKYSADLATGMVMSYAYARAITVIIRGPRRKLIRSVFPTR